LQHDATMLRIFIIACNARDMELKVFSRCS